MKHFDDIERMMLEIFPLMQIEEDNEGQLIIYTDQVPATEEHCGRLMEGWYVSREELLDTP